MQQQAVRAISKVGPITVTQARNINPEPTSRIISVTWLTMSARRSVENRRVAPRLDPDFSHTGQSWRSATTRQRGHIGRRPELRRPPQEHETVESRL
jgi:hypothetical protein